MDGGGDGVASGPEKKQEKLPEVPLQWTDFMWALEKLRHKPYSKRTRERDWFRINPLEMVLMGGQSVVSNSTTRRENLTMVLSMGSLAEEMLQRPRYWLRLFSVLSSTIQCKEIPPIILQRCCSLLVPLWKRLQQAIPEFHPFVCGWCVKELNLIEVLERMLHLNRKSLGATNSTELQQWVGELEQMLASATESCQKLLSQRVLPSPDPPDVVMTSSNQETALVLVGLRDVLKVILEQCGGGFSKGDIPQIHIQVYTIYEDAASFELKLELCSLMELMSVIKEGVGDASNVPAAVAHLLAILQLLAVRWREPEPVPEVVAVDTPAHLTTTPVPVVRSFSLSGSHGSTASVGGNGNSGQLRQDGGEEEEKLEEEEEEEEREEEKEGSQKELPPSPPTPTPQLLIEALTASLKKWSEMCEASTTSHNAKTVHHSSSVAAKLFSLIHTVLSFSPLHESLPSAISFLDKPLSLLMAYSTEGYLSDSPGEFLEQLLEFITSLVEQGCSLDEALQTNLPNLFGPAFGIRSHAVSCKLLEFGYLAVVSQHKKILLTKGLRFLMEVFHLFPPLDQVMAEAKACAFHAEALSASRLILEQLLAHVVPDPLNDSNDVCTDEVGGDDVESEELEGSGFPSLEPESDVIPSAVTDEMRLADKQSRLQVLLKLLQLACVMIRSGDDITFVFASTLPKLFRAPTTDTIIKFNKQKLQKFFGEEPPPPPSQITWKVDKKELAIQLLDLATLFVENDAASPFQLCGIVIPKLVKSLNEMTLSDEEKMSLTLEVLKVTREMLEAGHDIDDLISHGIDLIAILLPKTSNCQELRRFISQIASHLVTFNLSSMLFLIKNACQFMKNAFPDEVSDIQQLFKALLFRGKRDEIRGIFRVCKEPIRREQFVNIHRYLYGYAAGKLSHRQLIALCEVLIHAMDIEKPQKVVREIVTNVEEEEESLVEERSKLERAVMTRLASPSLQQLEAALQENRFKREVWEDVLVQLAQIALFRTLFQSEFASFSHLSKEQLLDMFKGKFPPDVLSSEDTMKLLSLSATRIEHMQVPRYDSLKLMLAGILRHFLTLDISAAGVVTPPQAETAAVLSSSERGEGGQEERGGGGGSEEADSEKSALGVRMASLERYIEQLPRNVEDRRKLMDHGYSERLWDQVSLSVKTDGSLSLEENMRQNLLACYTELVDILKQMAVTHVSVDGEMVKCAELFSDELSLADLKGRRAVAIRAIDQKRGGMPNEGHFYERKIALLAKEDQIEADFEKMSKSAIKPKLFRVTLNTKFFDCARCCGAQIIGCYAPTGEHCERPLEIGLRVDSGIASIYDEAGLEIENAELLFTEEGAYLFKAYSNGHPYDTSQVWVALFTALLKEEEEESSSSCPATGGPGPPLLPAIIVPAGYPNQRTWEALRRCVSTELTGSILTCRHDFSPEWRSYYDHRPERVRMGMDIVLYSGFSLTSDPARPVFQRQRSKFTKDLAGLIFEEAMQNLLEDEWLKQFKFLGKVMSQYISVCISEGVPKAAIISDGFNYERWRKTAAKNKQVPGELLEGMPEKEAVVDQVVSFLDSGIVGWCEEIDLPSLCLSNHKQLLELKGFLERSRHFREKGTLKDKLKQLRGLLGDCMFTVPLLSLPDSLQEEIVHWVFRNEDRVWRYRGGRDGHETLQQFMNFLGREKAEPDHGGGSPHERATEGQEEGARDKVVRSSRDDVSMAMDKPRLGPNTYAGVVVFCVPIAAETGIDFKSLQVDQMVAYAVGEMSRHVPTAQDGEVQSISDHEENQQPNSSGGSIASSSSSSSSIIRRQSSTAVRYRRQRPPASCYEVVTAWVHPSYRGLGLSTQMYLQIVRQVPARLVICDMMVGSVERIIGSSWLLGVLDRLRVLSLVVQRRQLSYNVTTQTGASEQFEQVLFNVRPMRLTLKIYDALRWCRANPGLTASLSLALPVAIAAALGTVITVKLLTR